MFHVRAQQQGFRKWVVDLGGSNQSDTFIIYLKVLHYLER